MIDTFRNATRRLRTNERGLTTVEYTIVLCLIAALCVGVWKTFGGEVKDYITGAGAKIDDNVRPALEENN